MPQVFHRSFNTIARVSLLGLAATVAAAGWFLYELVRSPYVTGEEVTRLQPVPFSHQHHVGVLGFDCRYCHSTVEESPYAGMPSTKTCMNCHSQIWVGSEMLAPVRESYRTGQPLEWHKVHRLPHFVYFDHSIHVNKGIGCATCHGRVDQMRLMRQAAPLTMEWCLECHRHPERFVRPKDEVFDMAWKAEDQRELGETLVAEYGLRRLTSCSTCHR